MESINYANLVDNIENCIILFNSNYDVVYGNSTAKNLLQGHLNLLGVFNKEYKAILKNGVENKFAFIITEHFKHSKPIFNTTADSYRVIVKPVENGMFLLEGLGINTINTANKFLRAKTKEYEKKLHLLNKLINMKRKTFVNFDIKNEDLLAYYEEQLQFELAMDAALAQIYEPMISQASTIKDIAKTIISQAKKLTGSEHGYVFTIDSILGDSIIYVSTDSINRSDDDLEPYKEICLERGEDNQYVGLWGQALNTRQAFFTNSLEASNFSAQTPFLNHHSVKSFLAVPVMLDRELVGQIALANAKDGFTKQDLRAVTRLAQFYALAIQRKRGEEELKNLATFDAMTGVLNRRTGLLFLEKYRRLAERNNTKLTIYYIDVNGLKKVNDGFGHKEGDILIKTVIDTIKKELRNSDIISRLGGDEFIIFFPDTSVEGAGIFFKRIMEKIDDINKRQDKPYEVSISYGFVEYSTDVSKNVDQLLEVADKEMYRNKELYKKTH